MKRAFAALTIIAGLAGVGAFVATFLVPVQATTLPGLQPIYVAAGVADFGFVATSVRLYKSQ